MLLNIYKQPKYKQYVMLAANNRSLYFYELTVHSSSSDSRFPSHFVTCRRSICPTLSKNIFILFIFLLFTWCVHRTWVPNWYSWTVNSQFWVLNQSSFFSFYTHFAIFASDFLCWMAAFSIHFEVFLFSRISNERVLEGGDEHEWDANIVCRECKISNDFKNRKFSIFFFIFLLTLAFEFLRKMQFPSSAIFRYFNNGHKNGG